MRPRAPRSGGGGGGRGTEFLSLYFLCASGGAHHGIHGIPPDSLLALVATARSRARAEVAAESLAGIFRPLSHSCRARLLTAPGRVARLPGTGGHWPGLSGCG